MHHPTPTDAAREAAVATYWPQDREERAALWNAAMRRGVEAFWREHDAQVAERGAR